MTFDPFASLAATLQGHTPPQDHGVSYRAEQLRRVAHHLRQTGTADAQHVAEAFETYLETGGDLERLLGVQVRSGGANDRPHRAARRLTRDRMLRDLAASLHGTREDRADRIAQMLVERHPAVLVIHQQVGRVPTSSRQLMRVLRAD